MASLDETQKTIERMREMDEKFLDLQQDLDNGMERMKTNLYNVLRENSEPNSGASSPKRTNHR